jgi:hypothetical protein
MEGLEPSRFNEPTDFHKDFKYLFKVDSIFILDLILKIKYVRIAPVESLHLSNIFIMK